MALVSTLNLLIYYDLELTDGSFASEIYQVGGRTSNSEFSTFILPNGSIDWGVTKYAGGTKIGKDENGQRQIIKSGKAIESVSAEKGLHSFIDWMKKLKERGKFENVILIAHGNSDMPALLNNVSRVNLTSQFKAVVDYFVDSLKYFESHFPDWEKYNISAMYMKTFNCVKTDVHDALEDAKALHDIIKETHKTTKDLFMERILKASVSIEDGYTISAKKVSTSIRKRKMKPHMSSNVKMFCAFPTEILEKLAKDESNESTKKHPVSSLIEFCRKRRWDAPVWDFSTTSNSDSPHTKQFIFKVVVNQKTYQPTEPSGNKKKAKVNAATLALRELQDEEGALNS